MIAWAAETAGHAAESGSIFTEAEFWVAIGLALFLFFVGKRAFNLVGVALDDRALRIKNRIDEAARMAEEAQALLATYERKQRDAAEEAEAILDNARREAKRFAEEAKAELERTLKRREVQALERIAQAEQAAVAEVRGKAVDVAVEATRKLMTERLTPTQADLLIDTAIKELPKKLH